MFTTSMTIKDFDADLFAAMESERQRQEEHIELIASENYTSPRVMEAQGSVLTNKYAEGYPGKRYYGGCEFVDVVENLAIKRAKQLFNCKFANVQPHSGSQANQTVLLALLKPGDKMLGMSLAAGGHLTHGAAPNLSGKWFEAIQYGVRQSDCLIDLDQVRERALLHKPKIIIAENVKGLLIGEARGYVSRIYDAFDEAGYIVQHWLLDSSSMGVPQRRERVFFIAFRKV